jgi:citronellyl-CoA dehydrogenase
MHDTGNDIYGSPEHRAFRETVRRFVQTELVPRAREFDKMGRIDKSLYRKMGELGLLGIRYGEQYGGQGLDYSYQAIFLEEVALCDNAGVCMGISVQTDMATPALHRFGSEELKKRYLVPAIRGEQVAAIAVTEPSAGSDVAGIRTRAVRDGDHWVINGSKMYITNSLQADWMCLLARTSDEGGYAGMSQIVVETSSPGFEVSKKLDKLGMRASDTGLLSFHDMRVPVENVIGVEGQGFQQQMNQFVIERMWSTYSVATSMERALERTRDYLKERVVFGKPLMKNQYLQYRLSELAAEVDMLKQYNYVIAAAHSRGEDVTRMATIAKWKSGRLSREVADWCLQFHGGIGYIEETWTARFMRDTRLQAIGAGSDETMLQVLARIDGYWM